MTRTGRAVAWPLGLAIGWGVCVGADAQPQDYLLDPTHSFVTFEVLHFGTSTLRGRFGPLQGQVSLDRAARSARVQVAIETAAVSTGVPVLDARLRQADLLASAAHPQAWFVAERFDFDERAGIAAARGELTLRGRSAPLTLQAERFGCYLSPLLRRQVCGGDFTAELLRSEWGMSYGLPFVGDVVRLRVQVEAIAQYAAPAADAPAPAASPGTR
ncbi:MAG: YceI family protein [Aquabacterium sp.]|nr:YceI family protein [Aquabacterium sp.]